MDFVKAFVHNPEGWRPYLDTKQTETIENSLLVMKEMAPSTNALEIEARIILRRYPTIASMNPIATTTIAEIAAEIIESEEIFEDEKSDEMSEETKSVFEYNDTEGGYKFPKSPNFLETRKNVKEEFTYEEVAESEEDTDELESMEKIKKIVMRLRQKRLGNFPESSSESDESIS